MTSEPDCLPAAADPRAPSVVVPPDACDCHAHIFGPAEAYPFSPERGYTPPPAPLSAYRHMLDRLDVRRAVIVQPSVYGTDNRCTLDAVADGGGGFRAVVVVDEDISDAELERMHEAGARGVRLNLLFPGGPGDRALEPVAARIAGLGWHLQLLVDVATFPHLRRRLEPLPTTIVFDHMGHLEARRGPDDPGFREMLRLVEERRAWVKLSGPYRLSSQATAPWADTLPLAEAIVGTDPERCVWATDWPHPALKSVMPDDGDLMDVLAQWVPDARVRQRILVDNPAVLYGFE